MLGIADYSHQKTRPSRTQKWDWHPDFRQTDGWSDGCPKLSTAISQRGRASLRVMSSILSPHPHGHRMPTLQSSPSSRTRTRSRAGKSDGKVSPSITCRRRAGPYRSHSRRNQRNMFILHPFSTCGTAATRAAAPLLPDQAVHSPCARSRPQPDSPRHKLRG